MLSEVGAEAEVRDTFATCAAATGLDLWQLVSSGPAEELDRTENTQSAMLAASVSLYRLWQRAGHRADFAAGHSLGEYSALVAAGCLELEEVATLVHLRARLMQRAVPAGSGSMMAILGLDDVSVEDCCKRGAATSGEVVSAANYNAPGQVVIAGSTAAVEAAAAYCHQAGAKRAIQLPVSVPSHCALMSEAAAELAEHLRAANWRPPEFPLIQNVIAEPVTSPEQIAENLILQLHRPVRWQQSVLQLMQMGAERLVECGPGRVLSGLARKIVPGTSTEHAAKMLETIQPEK